MSRAIAGEKRTRQDYFDWLCNLIRVDDGQDSYWILAKELHHKEFRYIVANDDNRAADGEYLRKEYISGNPRMDINHLNMPCSVFEMLVALARRMDFELSDLDNRDRTHKYFWELIDNLGLMEFTDEEYSYRQASLSVDSILEIFLNREYRQDGRGGLFPLKNPSKDQRKVELWYQMNAYINENYGY